MSRRPPRSTLTGTLVPYTTRFRSREAGSSPARRTPAPGGSGRAAPRRGREPPGGPGDPGSWERRCPSFSVLGRSVNRSEEHTSELQSLMRISYAVFCLKKKKDQNHTSRNAQEPNLTLTDKDY